MAQTEQARCRERPPAALVEAVRLFNAGRYNACARAIVPLWNGEPEPIRLLYRGLAQAAAGLLHLRRHNVHGSRVKLASALRHLQAFQPRCLGIDVDRLVGDLTALHAEAVHRDVAGLAALDGSALPRVYWMEEPD